MGAHQHPYVVALAYRKLSSLCSPTPTVGNIFSNNLISQLLKNGKRKSTWEYELYCNFILQLKIYAPAPFDTDVDRCYPFLTIFWLLTVQLC
jgi:hypothetical protein